jgi:transcriptional/translational regulatory protein YebC/TACO1
MPKENVERAKKATDKDTADYKAVLFEGYASWDCPLIETATDIELLPMLEVILINARDIGNARFS